MAKNINSTNGKELDLSGKNKKAVELEKADECNATRNGKTGKRSAETEERPKQRYEVRNLLHKLEAAKNVPKETAPEEDVEYYIGIDLGDKRSFYCILDRMILWQTAIWPQRL